MNLKDIHLRPCKYKLKRCLFKIEGRNDFECNPDYVSEIYIEKDFQNMVFPYFEITVSLPPSTYRDMRKENIDLRCYLELQYAYVDLSMNNEQSEENLSFNTFIQNTFYIFLDDNTPDFQSNFTETYESGAGIKRDEYGIGDMITTRFLLYNEEFFFKSRNVINTVLRNVTLPESIIYILNKSGLKNIIMSPPNNVKKYDQMIITPLPVSDQLVRLSSDYMLYDFGATVFFDFERGYILNNANISTAWEPNEIKKVYIVSKQNSDDASSIKVGSYEDPSRKFYVLNLEAGRANFNNGSLITNQAKGNDIISIDTHSGKITNQKSNSKLRNENKQIIVSNIGEDNASSIAHTIKNTSRIAKINFTNINIDIFKPNKEFIFSFDSAEYSDYMGSYHLSSFSTDLQREGSLFISSSETTFVGYDSPISEKKNDLSWIVFNHTII